MVSIETRPTAQPIPIQRAPISRPRLPKSLPESKVKWLLIRDKIVVNADLKKEIEAEISFRNLAKGTSIGFIAREIVHDKSFDLKLEGFPLYVIADVYDGKGRAIDTSGSAGAAGAAGGMGLPGTASQNSGKDGGPGGSGKNGMPGAPASPITLIAVTVRQAKLIAQGGPGGAGGGGGTGGAGAKGKTSSSGKFDPIDPTNGGPGGNGGNGGSGGPGAQITVHYAALEGALVMDGAGGVGGLKGAAGAGGNGAAKGAAGKPGAAGAAGKSVAGVKTQHAGAGLKSWDEQARGILGNTVEKWADYRTRVGEYAFRRLSGSQSGAQLRAFARDELLAATRLWSDTARAVQFLSYLDSNLTPVGVPYDHDVMPDFERFEKVLTDYGPMVQSLFSDALLLLQNAMISQINNAQLGIDLGHIDGIRGALSLELLAKGQEEAIVAGEIGHAQGRLDANEVALNQNRAQQAKEKMEAANGDFLGTVLEVVGAVVAVAAAIYTGGATLGALSAVLSAGGLLANADQALGWTYDKAKGTYVKGEQSLVNLFDWSGDKPKLKDEFKDLAGGIQDLVNKTKDFIDKAEAVRSLLTAKVDGKLENAEKELLVQHIDLMFEVNTLGLKQEQIRLERAAIEQERSTAEADYQAVEKLEGQVQGNIKSLGGIAQALIRQAQSYADLILKHIFYATRAYDLWTLSNATSSFTFDYGYLSPDEVEHAFQAAARGDGSRILGLTGKYLPSWNKLPDLIKLRDKHEKYSTDLQTDVWYFNFTDPGVLASLKTHGSATFRTEMPAGRFEAKVLNVGVALVGATAEDPSVTVIVEHTGDATVTRRDGKTVTIRQGIRREPVSASFDADDPGDLDEAEKQQFWGRSPAAVWRISIDKQSAVNSHLDLTGLAELQFAVYYKCFLVSQ